MSIEERVHVGGACLPGEIVLQLKASAAIIIGPGLRRLPAPASSDYSDLIVATLGGILVRSEIASGEVEGAGAQLQTSNVVWRYEVISSSGKRYFPRKGDPVVGFVTKVFGLTYQVNIGASHPAVLDGLSFDGATKSNRPKLTIGSAVYAHVTCAEKDIDTELSCCALPGTEAKDWVTGEGTFGPLKKGAVANVPLNYSQELLRNATPLLSLLGDRVAYEACVGVNGRVWLYTGGPARAKALVGVLRCVVDSVKDVSTDETAARVDSIFPPQSVTLGGVDAMNFGWSAAEAEAPAAVPVGADGEQKEDEGEEGKAGGDNPFDWL